MTGVLPFFVSLNDHLCFSTYKIASFWLKMTLKLTKSNLGGEYHSDIFSLIGTVFLWMFWPSFNSAPGPDSDLTRYMAVVNTYLALCGSCMMTYATSIWATPGRKITMEHVQNATLAGGVAMGTAASMPVQPFGALIIGGVAITIVAIEPA